MSVDMPPAGAESILKGPPLKDEPGLGTLTLPGFLSDVTAKYADREALVFHHGGNTVRWSYRDVWDRAVEVAQALIAAGVGKDSRVGVLMTNRPEWIAAAFGVGLAGGVLVALSTFSTAPELEYLLEASAVSVLLFERHVGKTDFAARLTALEPAIAAAAPGQLLTAKFPFLRHIAVIDDAKPEGAIESWSGFLARGREIPQALVAQTMKAVLPADTGVLFFSSGSTARPKGILSAHRGVAIQCWRWRRMLALGDDVRTWTANAFFWSGNFGMALGATFASGGSIVLQRFFDVTEALQLMQDEKVTHPVAWPHQWAQLAAAPNFQTVDLSSFRYLDANNAVIPKQPTITSTWYEPRWAYGNTETFTLSTAYPSGTPDEIAGQSHGVPLPGNTIKIVDPQTGKTVPRGQRGEIAVKGPTLMMNYLGIPADETFDEDGFFATGDGGYVDEQGRLVWEGRMTDIIKTGGANVSPLEIDAAAATYPGVKVVRTVGVPHDTLGEMVVACVVPQAGVALEEAAIRDYLKERLAAYKVPRRVIFVRDEDLAMTGSAKVKSASLRELAAQRIGQEA